MITAISTSDPNTERVGDWRGWGIQTSLLRSTGHSSEFTIPVRNHQCAEYPIRRLAIFERSRIRRMRQWNTAGPPKGM
jgi:hypothetical protein